MKTLSTQLKAHLQGYVTTVCTCWKITRTDGVILGFTDHDADIVFGGITYLAETGYTRTAIVTDLTLNVDNMEVDGILSPSYIDEHDLRNGVYNYARVDIILVNWMDRTMGSMALRRGWFGEITVTPNGFFKTELRGLTQALAMNFGYTISPTCRNDLGDSMCKIPIAPAAWQPGTVYPAGSWIVAILNSAALPADPYGGVIFQATVGGTSGTSQPGFVSTGPVSDNGITWTPYNSFTKQGSILSVNSRKSFVVTGIDVPASGLYGNVVNNLGITYEVITTGINSGGFPAGEGYNVVTCDVYASEGAIFLNTDVPGGSGLILAQNMDGTQHATMKGPLEVINSILSQGFNWVSSNASTATITITAGDQQSHTFATSFGVPQLGNYYANAQIYFVSGPNAGKSMEVNNYTASTVNLWLSLPFTPQVGDVFRIYPGCDKSRPTCLLFGNVINFHGEPDLPGQDFLYSPNLSM